MVSRDKRRQRRGIQQRRHRHTLAAPSLTPAGCEYRAQATTASRQSSVSAMSARTALGGRSASSRSGNGSNGSCRTVDPVALQHRRAPCVRCRWVAQSTHILARAHVCGVIGTVVRSMAERAIEGNVVAESTDEPELTNLWAPATE
jgi:hypothetical protein